MPNRIEIKDDDLGQISGGQITYTWDGTIGSLGVDGYNPYLLLDKEKFLEYYNANKETVSESKMIKYLKDNHIIKLP